MEVKFSLSRSRHTDTISCCISLSKFKENDHFILHTDEKINNKQVREALLRKLKQGFPSIYYDSSISAFRVRVRNFNRLRSILRKITQVA